MIIQLCKLKGFSRKLQSFWNRIRSIYEKNVSVRTKFRTSTLQFVVHADACEDRAGTIESLADCYNQLYPEPGRGTGKSESGNSRSIIRSCLVVSV